MLSWFNGIEETHNTAPLEESMSGPAFEKAISRTRQKPESYSQVAQSLNVQ
jgi:hypothetical protein